MPRPRKPGDEASGDDQTASDIDQTIADADQTTSDTDQSASDRDQAQADVDQRASDRDQEASDRELDANPIVGAVWRQGYEMSRAARGEGTLDRFATRKVRAQIASERDEQAERRDETARARDLAAEERDRAAEERDREVEELEKEPGTEPRVTAALEAARREAAIARARAAADRERAALDREAAARDRDALLHEAERSHFDELTGAYRREVGEFVLGHEIDSARRSKSDLRFAYLAVEGLGETNRREGQAAGDALLCDVFATLRANLRQFDPIVRWHGGEFVCAISGADLPEVRGRLDAAVAAVAKARPGASIRVGLVELREDDTVATAVDRADEAARTPDLESGA